MSENLKFEGLRLVVLIAEQLAANKADQLMQRAGFPVRYRFWAQGTASSELLDYMGLVKSEKVVLLCTAPKTLTPKLLDILRRDLDLEKPGHGMAFTIPLSGASNPLAQIMNKQVLTEMQNKIENEVRHVMENTGYCLIMAAVSQGFSEDVMEAAKAVGARGGTVISGRRLGMEDSMQFWGISLQSERDIVAIVAPREQKLVIMKAIGEKCGINSEANGLIFSMPVDGIEGIN